METMPRQDQPIAMTAKIEDLLRQRRYLVGLLLRLLGAEVLLPCACRLCEQRASLDRPVRCRVSTQTMRCVIPSSRLLLADLALLEARQLLACRAHDGIRGGNIGVAFLAVMAVSPFAPMR